MLTYEPTTIGTMTIDRNGEQKTIQYRLGNCLAVLIYEYEEDGHTYHQLYNFYGDEQHCKNIMKNDGDILFGEKPLNITLNLYYRQSNTLLKYLVKSGHRVNCYYEEPSSKK